MVNIGLDLRALEKGFKAHLGRGTGRYALELSNGLARLNKEAQEIGISISPVGSTDITRKKWQSTLIYYLPFGKQTIDNQLFYSQSFRSVNIDVMHFFSHGDAPAFPCVPQIVTVLDLIPLRFPDLYKPKKSNLRFRFARYLEYQAIKNALGVLTISEATKADVVELLGVDEKKIRVTPLGVDESFFQRNELNSTNEREFVTRSLGIPKESNILLYVGGIDPRKNILFLLEVFSSLYSVDDSFSKPVLVLAGNYKDDEQYSILLAKVKELGISDKVYFPGYVEDALLKALYRISMVFLFPSLYEGFGLPVLEAMASGVPVVAGKNSSIPEVASDAAILCSDNNVQDWLCSIVRLLQDQSLKAMLVEKGLRQARKFSWNNTAVLTLDAYRTFVAQIK